MSVCAFGRLSARAASRTSAPSVTVPTVYSASAGAPSSRKLVTPVSGRSVTRVPSR